MAQQHQQGRQCPCKLLPQCLSSFTAAEYGDLHSLSSRQDAAFKLGTGGLTPLHYSAQNGHAAATALLLGLGADVDGRPRVQDMSLSVLQDGENAATRSEKAWCGATPLHRASFSGAVSAMQVLLQWNGGSAVCDLLAKDTSFGDLMTPLHKAAAGGRPLAVQLLLETLRSRTSHGDKRDNMLQRGLTALDSQGRTPLEVAKSIDPVEEGKSVKRWDSVAGGLPDWQQCIAILERAEQEIGIVDETPRSPSRLPTLPKHLLDTSSCLDCGADDGGTCLTSSWEQAFRSVLTSSAKQAVGNTSIDTSMERNAKVEVSSMECNIVPKRNVDEMKPTNKDNVAELLHNSVAVNPAASAAGRSTNDSPSSKVRMGQTCSSCGDHSLALFRGNGGGLVCKKCRGRCRQSNIVTVVKM